MNAAVENEKKYKAEQLGKQFMSNIWEKNIKVK